MLQEAARQNQQQEEQEAARKEQQRLDKQAASVALVKANAATRSALPAKGTVFKVVCNSKLRAGFAMSSADKGVIKAGKQITALAVRKIAASGIIRVQCDKVRKHTHTHSLSLSLSLSLSCRHKLVPRIHATVCFHIIRNVDIMHD